MNTTVAIRPTAAVPALAINEQELMGVLRSSLYVGAADESIKLVVGYCRAAGLDPMQKPVHIVPMWDSKAGSMRDVIMPGVGLYRTQAARSGQLAGISEPEFGPDTHQELSGTKITFPAWCRVTVKRRLPTGEIAEFTATERWIENYAQKGGKEKSIAPNAMWMKRPYAQLAKCAQAQALRIAFPEMTGAAPTADEMEGKAIDAEVIDNGQPQRIEQRQAPKTLPPCPDQTLDRNHDAWIAALEEGSTTTDAIIAKIETRYSLTEEQKASIHSLGKTRENANA